MSGTQAGVEPKGRWRIIFLCSLAMALAFMDRGILPLFIEPVRHDLRINDVEFSLLSGLAFSIFYSICSIPAGRLIDSKSRPLILGAGVLIWSAATSLTGFAGSFLALFAARMAVGVGESVVSPCSQSMATDMFMGTKSLGKALSTVSIGVGIGSGSALLLGGAIAGAIGSGPIMLPIIGPMQPWQFTFFVLGLPGLILGPIILATVKDPKRIRLAVDKSGAVARTSYLSMLRFAASHRSTVALTVSAYAIYSIGTQALAQWAPAHLLRTFHAPIREVGMMLGVGQMIGATLGLIIGGRLIDRWIKKGRPDAAPLFSITCALIALPGMLIFPFMPTMPLAVAAIVWTSAIGGVGYATSAVGNQQFVPNQMRAQYSASYLVISSIIGGTMGPFIVASLNEGLFHDPQRIGQAASIVGVTALTTSAILLGLALRHFRKTMGIVDSTTRLPAGDKPETA